MHKLTLIVGKSGCGKSSLAKKLEDYGYYQLPSFTTREMRKGEVDGKDHLFISLDSFNDLFNNGEIAAHTYFNGNYYGATKQQIRKYDTYIIDVFGVKDLIKNCGYDIELCIIYIETSTLTRAIRMKKRGDGIFKIISRLIHDHKAFKGIYGLEDYIIDGNKSLNNVIMDTLESLIGRRIYFG